MKQSIHSFFRRLIPVIIDIATLFIFTISLWIVAENASGNLFPHKYFMSESTIITKDVGIFFIVLAFIYYCVAALNKWKTIGKIVCENWRRVILSLLATVVDFTCVLVVTLLIDQLLQKWFYVETFNILFIVLFIYALVSGLITKGKTIGKYFFGISLQTGNSRTNSLKYEIGKFGILIACPYLLLLLLGIVDSFAIFLNIALLTELIVVFSFMCCKKTLWAKFAGIPKMIKPLSVSKLFLSFFVLIALFAGSYLLLRHSNNKQQPDDTVSFGFHFPSKFPEYPNLSKVQPYSDYLKTQKLSPKEYILNLFERYDVVILEEAFHTESTQWEMIGDLVADSTFIERVGNIFTEYGSAMHQNKIDTFLHTVFHNDTILEQETAILMNYMTGGFYYFIKNLNLLNATLPDSLKVRQHYCDNIDWDYFSTIPIHSVGEERDSMMAQVVIDWHKQQVAENKRHKCLVVTNTRHAYGYAGGVEKVKNNPSFRVTRNQGEYIYIALPGKAANIIYNSPKSSRSLFFPMHCPINCGIWDKAFAMTGNRPVGFDLKETPFGNDCFSGGRGSRRGGKNLNLQYSDIFTGVIFNKPYMEMRSVIHPYRKWAVKEEAARKGITDTMEIQGRFQYFHNDEVIFEDNMKWANSISMANFAGLFFVFLFMCLSVFLSVLYLFRKIIANR